VVAPWPCVGSEAPAPVLPPGPSPLSFAPVLRPCPPVAHIAHATLRRGGVRMTSTVVNVRAAGAGDVDAVVDLVHSAYRGDTSRAGWTTEADLLDGIRTNAEEVTK